MAGEENPQHEPVWKRPAWLTAIVGVISVFLTVPDKIGDYLTKQQDVEIAKQKVTAAELENRQSKQDQEFIIVQNTLAQQGPERVFLLRYFAATLDDDEAKQWAAAEVKRLDEIATLREERERQQREIEQREAELHAARKAGNETVSALEAEIAGLKSELAQKDGQVEELRQKAGIGAADAPRNVTYIRVRFEDALSNRVAKGEESDVGQVRLVTVNFMNHGFRIPCRPKEECDTIVSDDPPRQIVIRPSLGPVSIYVKYYPQLVLTGVFPALGAEFDRGITIPYQCTVGLEDTVCRVNSRTAPLTFED